MALNLGSASSLKFTANPNTKWGASTLLVILRRNQNSTTGGAVVFAPEDSLTNTFGRITFAVTSDLISSQGGNSTPTMNAKVADGWICIAVTKVGGFVVPRAHKYVYATGVSTHENMGGSENDTLTIGAGGTAVFGRNVFPNSDASYAAGAIYDRVLSDQEFETAAVSLAALKASQPNWGLWVLNGSSLTTGFEEFFIGSTFSSGTATSVDGGGSPFGYGELALIGLPDLAGGGSAATFTGTGYLTADRGTPVYPPAPGVPAVGAGDGFSFALASPAQVIQDIHFTTTGDFTHDQNRSVRRAISGFRLLPSEAAKVNMARDEVYAFLNVNGESFPMGVFRFTESSRVKDAIIDDDGNPADLIDVALSDRFVMLQRSSESPVQIIEGSDPSQEMIRILDDTGIPHSITGSVAPIADNVVWQPFTTAEEIVSQLAEIAGHRRPWADNYGVIRSVTANVVDSEILILEDDLHPVAGTIVVTENYLSAPNRVVVFDDQGAFPIVGSWDAPASAPNSFVNRGWTLTAGVPQQGLSGPIHAQQIARTVGEQMSARSMTCQILPTNRLDGPRVISFDGALWLTESWSVSSAPGSLMSASFRELIPSTGGEVE